MGGVGSPVLISLPMPTCAHIDYGRHQLRIIWTHFQSCGTKVLFDTPSAERSAKQQEVPMANVTYYVALAFAPSEDGDIVACEPKEARSADQAIRMAKTLAAMEPHCGAIAFSRTGDPALGDFEDAVVLKMVGEVDEGFLKS
jgi:hypothetical protein